MIIVCAAGARPSPQGRVSPHLGSTLRVARGRPVRRLVEVRSRPGDGRMPLPEPAPVVTECGQRARAPGSSSHAKVRNLAATECSKKALYRPDHGALEVKGVHQSPRAQYAL